ncbi:DUF2917 domain-containing protein [Noviherbaspirillum saxi]|nr:DUF2917 domain-containing protein [Noviherbaspirillum saxi]
MNAKVHKTSVADAVTTHDSAMHKLAPAGETITLDQAQAAHLHDAAGWTVRALDGSVWITQDGDIRDVVLETGEAFVLDRNVPALLSPLGKARISVRLDTCCEQKQPRRAGMTALPASARLSIA